jgi:hypothetical protein
LVLDPRGVGLGHFFWLRYSGLGENAQACDAIHAGCSVRNLCRIRRVSSAEPSSQETNHKKLISRPRLRVPRYPRPLSFSPHGRVLLSAIAISRRYSSSCWKSQSL